MHRGLADFLGSTPVAAEEQLLATDPAQHPKPRHGVRGQLRGLARLLALEIRTPRSPGEQRQHGEGQQRYGDRHQDAQRRQIQHEPHTDQHQRRGRRGEPRERLDEPADLLHITCGNSDHFARRDPTRQRRTELRGLTGEQLLDPGGGGDPVGDRRTVQHRVTHRHQHAQDRDQPARPGEPAAGTVDDRLDGEADRGWQTGEGALVKQAPGQGRELALELVAAEPEQEART
ncbi:hypothetical protein ACVWYT_001278 [Streptomyces sp. TE4109]